MQRCIRDNHTAHCHGGKPRYGRQRACAPHLDVNRLDPRPCQFSGEFMRNGPTRGGGAQPQAALQGQIIEFVDHPINIIAQTRAIMGNCLIMGDNRLKALAANGQGIGLKSKITQFRNQSRLRVCKRSGDNPKRIGKKPQRAGAGDLSIQLAQRSCGRIAWIGKGFTPCLLGARVERGEICVAHVNFTAHFENIRTIVVVDGLRNIGNRAGVGGDVFARLPIAARGGMHQNAVFIAQRQGQPIDFWLGNKDQGRGIRQAQIALNAHDKFRDIGLVKCIGQGHHAFGMGDFAKALGRAGADLRAWTIAADQIGKPRLKIRVFAFQAVIFRIAEGGRVFLEIILIGARQNIGQFGQTLCRLIAP